MTSSDQTPGHNNPENPDRLQQIKKEEHEDASSYYAQGGSEDKGISEEDFKNPLPPVDSEEEEMSLLKAVAFLGFGMAALAIIFILFFIRDLGNKVGDVDGAVKTLKQEFGPLKEDVETGFAQVNKDIGQLKEKFGTYEKMVAVMELKRAKVAIQEVTANTTPELQAKSGQVIANIDSLLMDLGAGEAGAAPVSPAPAPVESAPESAPMAPAAAPTPEPAPEAAPAAEPAVQESAPPPTTEEPSPGKIELKSESEEAPEAAAEDSGSEAEGGEDDEEDDEDEDDKE